MRYEEMLADAAIRQDKYSRYGETEGQSHYIVVSAYNLELADQIMRDPRIDAYENNAVLPAMLRFVAANWTE